LPCLKEAAVGLYREPCASGHTLMSCSFTINFNIIHFRIILLTWIFSLDFQGAITNLFFSFHICAAFSAYSALDLRTLIIFGEKYAVAIYHLVQFVLYLGCFRPLNNSAIKVNASFNLHVNTTTTTAIIIIMIISFPKQRVAYML
jgi:hypothetical protein